MKYLPLYNLYLISVSKILHLSNINIMLHSINNDKPIIVLIIILLLFVFFWITNKIHHDKVYDIDNKAPKPVIIYVLVWLILERINKIPKIKPNKLQGKGKVENINFF